MSNFNTKINELKIFKKTVCPYLYMAIDFLIEHYSFSSCIGVAH